MKSLAAVCSLAVLVASPCACACRSSVPDNETREGRPPAPSVQDSGSDMTPGPEPLPAIGTLWDWDDIEGTEARFRKHAAKAEARGDNGYRLEALTQAARTLGLRGNFDAAHALLDEIKPQLTDEFLRARIRYLLERGRTLNSSDHATDAVPLFVEAHRLAEAASEEGLALDAAHMVAIAAEPEVAMEWAHRAIAIAEASVNPRVQGWLGPLYNNTGWSYVDQEDYDAALTLFEKGYEWRKAQPDQGRQTCIARWAVAHVYRLKGEVQRAYDMHLAMKDMYAEYDIKPSGYHFEELGECLLLLDRADEAVVQFAKAYQLLSKDAHFVEHEAERLARIKALGHVDDEPESESETDPDTPDDDG